jgi:hypothetical protein
MLRLLSLKLEVTQGPGAGVSAIGMEADVRLLFRIQGKGKEVFRVESLLSLHSIIKRRDSSKNLRLPRYFTTTVKS